MRNCHDCVRESHSGSGQVFCKPCLETTVCKNCGAKDMPFNPMWRSVYEDKPICRLCFQHECCKCGVFADADDAEDDQFVWMDDYLFCESCSTKYICNQCGGDCDFPCPVCKSAHDNECHCEIICRGCDERFEYRGCDMWDRCHNSLWNLDRRKLCDDCWDDLLNGGGK